MIWWNNPQVTCIILVIQEPFGECVYREDTSGYFNHAIENTVAGKANIIKAQTTVERNWQESQCTMGRQGVVPLRYCTDQKKGRFAGMLTNGFPVF